MTHDELPDGMDPKRPHIMFQPGTSEDEAAAVFVRKFGRPPEYIAEVAGRLWVGPIDATP